MPGQFLSPEGDLEEHFITNHWLIDQYIGDQLWVWGEGISGYGNNTTSTLNFATTPVQEWTSSTSWIQVSHVNGGNSAAVKADGTLWTWGRNSYGELGVNDTRSRSTPVQEWTSSTNWKYVSVCLGNTTAIKSDGSLWAWGRNNSAVVAPDGVNRSTPVQEWTSSTNWKQSVIRRGNRSVISAIKTDGTLWSWGTNDFGQLGIGLAAGPAGDRSTPVQEWTSSTNWKLILSGPDCLHNGAIKTDGSLWMWGSGSSQQIGNRSNFSPTTPSKPILVFNDFIKNGTLGDRSTHVIKSDGTLWSWGSNYKNVFGNVDLSSGSSAVQESSYSTNWKQVSAFASTLTSTIHAIKTDGTMWGWGDNTSLKFPSISIGTQVSISTPIQESTRRTNWKQVSGNRGILTGIEMDTGNLTS